MYNILVCDDEKEITDAIEIYLSQEGYRVLKAYNGKQALEIMKKEEIHLLIIDLMMPEMDGIHAILEIRKTSSIPIIVLSASWATSPRQPRRRRMSSIPADWSLTTTRRK